MSIVDRISQDINAAMKARDAERLGALRLVKTALKNQEIELRKPLDDDAAVRVLQKLSNQRKDSIEQFEKAGRIELAAKERAELAIIAEYLPNAPDESEIQAAVSAAIAETGATEQKQMGTVIKAVMAKFAGRPVDGKTVSAAVKAALGG